MRLSLIPFFLVILLGCSKSNNNTWTILNPKNIVVQKQDFALELFYLGKDTLRIEAIALKDSLHLYKLTSNKPLDGINIYIFQKFKYYLDSSNDGGNTWSEKRFVLETDGNLSKFFISRNGRYKYIVTWKNTFVSEDAITFHPLDFFLNKKTSDSNEIKTISQDQLFNRNILYSLENKYFFVEDTVFKPETKGDKVFLNKVQPGDKIIATIETPANSLNDNKPLIRGDNYYIFSSPRYNSLIKYPYHTILYSKNAGITWDSIENNNFYLEKYFPNDGLVIGIDDSKQYKLSKSLHFLFDINNRSWSVFSDTILLSDSISKVDYSSISNDLFVIGTDSSQKINYGFRPQIKSGISEFFSQPQRYSIVETPDRIFIQIEIQKGKAGKQRISTNVLGATSYEYNQKGLNLLGKLTPNSDSTVWSFAFDPSKINLHEDEQYILQVFFADHSKQVRYNIERKFLPVTFYERYKNLIIVLFTIISYFVIIWIFWYFFPINLHYLVQKIPISKVIDAFPNSFQVPLFFLNLLFPFISFAKTARVTNAWIRKYSQILMQKFEEANSVKNRSLYIPITLKLSDSTTKEQSVFHIPDPSIVSAICHRKRILIEVIGDGGIGKTTLAIQLANWIALIESQTKRSQIIILIEFDTNNLIEAISDKLKAWLPDERIENDFILQLLKHKNIFVFVDALSELSVSMQDYIDNIHSKVPCNALIITSRKYFKFQGITSSIFYPLPLTPDKLLYFITHYLQTLKDNSPDFLNNPEEQLRFATEIVRQLGQNNENLITPLLVKIIIDNFYEEYTAGITNFNLLLQSMPKSIPGAYYKYLEKTNPENPNVKNYLSNEDMFKVAEILGHLSIEKNYIPQDFEKRKAKQKIDEALPHLKNVEVIQRLLDNTIINEKKVLGTYFLRFNLDPLAEYLGAEYYIKLNEERDSLNIFHDVVSNLPSDSEGFKVAYNQIMKLRHHTFEW